MSNKISVITVVFNDVANIRATLESFFSQTWEDKEYIVIDGGSTDGTVDIIKEYADKLAYWCSEKDNGIYDAMNKGIVHATGDWINILNSGDYYASNDALNKVITLALDINSADILYANSIEQLPNGDKIYVEANNDIDKLRWEPIYRHGSSLIRRKINLENLYETNRTDLGFALDWLQIHNLYKKGYVFKKVDTTLETFLQEGMSNDFFLSKKYNWEIVKGKAITKVALVKILLSKWICTFKKTNIYKWIIAIVANYIVNDILPHIPFWRIRKTYLNFVKFKIGKSFIMKNVYIMTPQKIKIGDNSHINRGCLLDGRGGILIGNNVSISHNVSLITGSHNINAPNFSAIFMPININDYVWIGANVTVLQNVKIGQGAVVCAGAVVTKDVEPYSIVAGTPARPIGKRNKQLNYKCNGYEPLT